MSGRSYRSLASRHTAIMIQRRAALRRRRERVVRRWGRLARGVLAPRSASRRIRRLNVYSRWMQSRIRNALRR